jgi:hypothetical protein
VRGTKAEADEPWEGEPLESHEPRQQRFIPLY